MQVEHFEAQTAYYTAIRDMAYQFDVTSCEICESAQLTEAFELDDASGCTCNTQKHEKRYFLNEDRWREFVGAESEALHYLALAAGEEEENEFEDVASRCSCSGEYHCDYEMYVAREEGLEKDTILGADQTNWTGSQRNGEERDTEEEHDYDDDDDEEEDHGDEDQDEDKYIDYDDTAEGDEEWGRAMSEERRWREDSEDFEGFDNDI
jgi:hypothetical protein